MCTVVLSLLFCQIQGKCLCNDFGWRRGILGSFDLWLAAVIDFVHDQTVGPCTYCILIEQYKKKLDALASFGEKSMVLALSINK